MHHVPYTHILHSGKTLIQHVYDSHYNGAATAASYPDAWKQLHGMVDEDRYTQVEKLFTYQSGHAEVWRDAVNDWFQRESGIDDTRGRVGHHPGRIEAESADKTGYKTVDVIPWETASDGKAVICEEATCALRVTFNGETGKHRIEVGYYDLRDGISKYNLLVNDTVVAQWQADDTVPPAVNDPHLDGHTAARFVKHDVPLHNGDTIELRGIPEGSERAPLDFIEITPDHRGNEKEKEDQP